MSRPAQGARGLVGALAAAAALALLGPSGGTARADPPAVAPAPVATSAPAAAPRAGASEFLAVMQVLESPRCRNCHPSDDRPRVGDAGRKHRMNISRRSMAAGLPCTTCHRGQNAVPLHGPPGVPGWRMPPPEQPMVFDGMAPHALCEQMKDPKRNGGKTIAALREHFARDPFVLWAWRPGPERTLPPMTHAKLLEHVDAWIAAGAPCPE